MPSRRHALLLTAAGLAFGASGCATAIVEPGHRGLMFAPTTGGLKHDVLQPGKYRLGACFIACTSNRIDDFDITYSTRTEHVKALSTEGLEVDLGLSVIYRPIASELYALDTEIGPKYYDEVVGPEFRSAGRGVLARHSFAGLDRRNAALEDEIEAELRRRTVGKHVEISAVTLESITYPPELAERLREAVAARLDAERETLAFEKELAHKKLLAEHEAELRRLDQPPTCAPAPAASR